MPGFVNQPSADELERRRTVGIYDEIVTNVTSSDFPHHYIGEDHSWNLEQFRNNLQINYHKNDEFDAVFSLVGVDASVANAFRRIMIAEVPTIAIEYVLIRNNTSIIQDEVLAHRLGLIPITANREGLRNLRQLIKQKIDDDAVGKVEMERDRPFEDPRDRVSSEENTLILSLQVECKWTDDGKKLAKQHERDQNLLYQNSNVYAKDFRYQPAKGQEIFNGPDNEPRAFNPDILIAKLRPGQLIDLQALCVRGIGADHSKFSPVATASYRLLPTIKIREPILGADAKKFARCFPKGVIGLEDDEETGEKKAVVKDTMKDTVSRECLRHDEFKDKVELGRIRDHFIFSVESTGQYPSDEIFLESVRILKEKAMKFKADLTELMN